MKKKSKLKRFIGYTTHTFDNKRSVHVGYCVKENAWLISGKTVGHKGKRIIFTNEAMKTIFNMMSVIAKNINDGTFPT